MDEKELKAIVIQMIADKVPEAEIKAKIAELRSQAASTGEPGEKHKALTVADASAEDISAVSIDADYWSSQKVDRNTVVPGKNKEHDEQIAKEEKIAKSVKTSGSEAEDDSSSTEGMPSVPLIEFPKIEDAGKILNDKYARYGFDIASEYDSEFFGGDKENIIVVDKDGNEKTFDLRDEKAKEDMDAWMRGRAVDQLADWENSLVGVKITAEERKGIAEDNASDFDRAFSGATGTANDSEIELKKKGLPASGAGSSFDETGTQTTAEKAFERAAFELTKRKFIKELNLTEEEKKNYTLTEADVREIKFKARREVAYDNPDVRKSALEIMNSDSQEGLLAKRIAEKASKWGDGKIGDFDQDVLEAIGKEKLEKLNKKQKATLGEYQVIKEKHTAIKGLFEASGEALKNYDAQGKIDAIKGREFKTQEEVDAAKGEIANIIAKHEKLAANYNSKLRDYELITDATIKASEKVGSLQLDIEDVGSYTQLVGLDYSLLNRMGEALGNTGIDLVQGAVSAGELVVDAAKYGIMTSGHPVMSGMLRAYENSGDGSPSAMEKAHAAVDAYQAKWSASMYHMQYDDIGSASDFGEWFAVMMAGQVPNLALMSVAGPASLYAMGITSTGQKYLDLKAQNKLYTESGGLYGNEYSFEEMFLNATVSGAAEALSEKITLGQVNAAKGVFKGMVKNKGVRAGVAEYLTKNVFTSKALLATGKDLLEEGTSEAIATISGNLMDIWAGNREAGFWDGVEESFVSGVMMSGALKSPVLANHALSAFGSPDMKAVRDANLTRINELSSALLGTSPNRKLHHKEELSEEAREVMEAELAELVAETTEMLEKDIKIVDTLSEDDKKKLLGLEKGKNKIRAQWESVKNDETLSETEKEAIKDRLNKKMMASEATKAEMLSHYTPEAADIKYSETTMPLKTPDQKLEENVEFAKKHSALYGLEVNDTMSPAEIEAYLLEKGYSEKDAKDGRESDGFIVGNDIVINREVAMAKDAVTVGSHELLHGILKKAMNVNSDLSTKVISQLKKEIGGQWSAVQQRIDANYSPEYMAKHPDEYLTLVSDAIANGEITYEETTWDKIRDAFNEMGLFKKAGFTKIKFKTGKDVYRFLREYNKSIHKGALSGRIVEATKGDTEGSQTDELTYSMSSDQKKTAAKNVKELGAKNTNKSWRKGGADAAIKEMKDQKYFDGLIASKYKVKPVPRDFVEKVYSEITAHIKRFKPEQNDDLFAYINSQITNKAGSVYNREYKVDEAMKGSRDIDAKTAEGTPVIQIAAETESSMEAFEDQDMSMAAQSRRTKLVEQGKSESDQYSGLRTELGLEKPMMDKVRKAVAKTFGTKLPDINSKKFKAALQKAYRTELKKPIQDMIGKGEAYNEFLSKNFPIVYKFLPKETLLQMERSVAADKRIFTKSERIIKTTEVDRLISEGLLPKETNRLSGPTLITKLPYPGSKKVMAYFRGKDMADALGYEVGTSTLGTRKDKLAMEMGVELGFDATMETVQQADVSGRRESILELTGQVQAANDISVIAKQIDRDPNIKFSFSLKKAVAGEKNALSKIALLGTGSEVAPFSMVDSKEIQAVGRLISEVGAHSFLKRTQELANNILAVLVPIENDPKNQKAKDDFSRGAIRGAIIATYGDVFNAKDLERLIHAIHAVATSNKLPKTAGKKKIVALKIQLDKLITDNDSKTAQWFGTGKTTMSLMSDPKKIALRRAETVDFMIKDADRINEDSASPEEAGLRIMRSMNMLKQQMSTAGKIGGKRAQYFLGKDFLETMNKNIPDLSFSIKEDGGGFKVDFSKPVTYKGKVLSIKASDLTLDTQTGVGVIKDHVSDILTGTSKVKSREAGVKEAREHLNNYVAYYVGLYEAGIIGAEDLQMAAANLLSNMNPSLARAAMPKFIAEDMLPPNWEGMSKKELNRWITQNLKGDLKPVFEHMQPRLLVVLGLFEAHLFNGGVTDVDAHFANYDVAIISDRMDKALKAANLNNSLAEGQTLDMESWIRYYNAATFATGKMKSLMGVGSNGGVSVGEAHQLASEILKERLESLDQAARANGLLKFSKSSKPTVTQSKMFNGSSKSFDELGGRTGVIFLASDKREAEAYAESNGGTVRDIYVDQTKVGQERQLLSKIEELGYSTEDALAYELMDTRFPNSLKQAEINEVIAALKKDGVQGIEYTDGAQVVGGTTKSAMIFDKAIISETPIVTIKPKGITVLDFDDTLATTKSGVKARIPNPDGTPKPGRKVIFMAGGAGSGKGNVISKLGLKEAGYKMVNSDISLEWLKKNHGLPENQSDYTAEQRSQLSKLSAEARKIAKRKQGKFAGHGDGVVVDGTGGSIKMMEKLVEEFKAKGYDVSMIFVETSLEVAQQRNAARKERSLREGILNKNHEQVQGNKEAFKALFGETFNEVSTDKIGLNDALPGDFKDKVDDFTNSYENRRLDAEEFAKEGGDIKANGGEFDFSEFNQVTEGETAPMFNKAMKLSGKFGTDNMFILTARSPDAAPAIKEFLDAQGLNIPLKNITGLGQSEASAKANWIAEKVGEGYNDFYFADDAIQNVDAVREKLNELEVKNKVQQAKIKFSMNTKRDLKWKSTDRVTFGLEGDRATGGKIYNANFKVGDNDYVIRLVNRSLNVSNRFIKGDSVFDLEFALENQEDELWEGAGKMGLEGTGRASEVLSIVSNGVMDFIKNNNVDAIGFTSAPGFDDATSRTRLYSTLTKFWASKLGWEWTSESETHQEDGKDINSGKFIISNPNPSDLMVDEASDKTAFWHRSTEEKSMLNMFDVKGKAQQARIKFSKSGPKKMSDIIDEGAMDLNTILEQTKGVDRKKVFSAAKARKRGKNKGRFKFFVPPSADDFAGLMYAFMGKGKQGEQHHQFFKENLFDPFSKGIRHLKQVQQAVANDLKELRKAMPDVRKKLDKTVPGTEYTHEDAIRVYNWVKAGFEVPGLSKTDKQALVDAVTNDASLSAFAQGISAIGSTPGGLVDPGKHWLGGNIALDLKEALDVARGTYLQQWKENVDIMFNEANLNKIEAVYGSNFREALEDSLWRMEHGGNRSRGSGRLLTNFTNWIHGSIGTTMFLNARSAMLQMISNVNFVNWSDNNMIAAAKAFGNQPQYWKDVAMIFNSPFLKQRRSGIQTDVNAAELLAQIKDSKNQVKAATAYLLQLGFTPTQIADSFAIATGGATLYRNRIKTYLKEGMTQAEAETKAFEDMMEIAEETQQSTREDKISQQQASPLGKFILAFQNTPMQYNRLIKKAALDLVNGRGDAKAHISRIIYYGGIQNLIFYGLQSAVFAALFSDDEEDQLTDKKSERIMNGMVDTLLRGSGIGGAVVATVKNVIIKFMKEEEKEKDDNFMTRANHAGTLIEALNISPPIGIKARKLYGATQTWDFNRDVIKHMSKTDIDNPAYDAISSATEAVTNIPLNRLYSKYQNISESLNADNEMWQRVAMFLGWSKWNFGIENQNVVTAKGEVKEIKAAEAEERKEMKKRAKAVEKMAEEEIIIKDNLLDQKEEREEGQEDIKCAAVSKSGARCGAKVKGGGNFCTVHEKAPQRASGEKTQCSHIKPNGDRCKMQTRSQSGKCYYHD